MKIKPVWLIVITLVIGFVLGMLTSAQIRLHQLKPFRIYFSEERFREGFYKIIQPDAKQKAEIEEILNKYAKLNVDLQNNMRKGVETNMNNMRKELDVKLTKDQLARLKEMDKRREEMFRQFRRNMQDSIDAHRMRPGGPQNHHFPDGRPMTPPFGPQSQPGDTTRITQ